MTNEEGHNGYRRGGDVPERMRRLLGRVKPGGKGMTGASTLNREALRADLHAAIDLTLDRAGRNAPVTELKHELQAATGRVIEEHIAPGRARPPAVPTTPPELGHGQSHPVDQLMERLDLAVQRTLGGAWPGMERGRAYLSARLPQLTERLTAILVEIAADERRMMQVEVALVRLLKSRMNEKTARRVARLAINAAKAAAWRKRRGSSER